MPYRRDREPTDPPATEVEHTPPSVYDTRQRAHVPVTRVTVGAMIALLREHDPESLFKVYAHDGLPTFEDPVLIIVPGAIYCGQACHGASMSVAISETANIQAVKATGE